MTTGAQYVNIKSKRLMGTDDFGDRMMEYMRVISQETNERTYDSSAFLAGDASLVADGNDQFRVDKALSNVVASDGDGHFLDPDWAQWDWFRNVHFENTAATPYYVALKYCLIPAGIQINPRTGAPEYVAYEDQVGEVANPDSVVDNGNDITFVVDGVTETGVDCTGRRVWVYMVNPAEGASTEVIAIEECVVAYTTGQNMITTSALLGQTTVSTTVAHYEVAALGPTVKRYTDLRVVADYAFIGIVTGVGAGSPPAVFDMADQRVVPYSWATALVDGLPQDFIPAVDNAYSLGSASRRWAAIYTANLVVTGDLLPNADDAQDLGSPSKRWAELHLSDTATVHSVIPAADAMYSLGTPSYAWASADIDRLSLGTGASEGMATHLMPMANNTFDLGGVTTQNWRHLYLYKLSLSASAGNGIQGDFVPGVTATYSLGTSGYVWEELWLSAAAGDGIQTDLVPGADDTHSLGNASYAWKKLFLSASAGDGIQGDFVPGVDDAYDLGDTTRQWRDLYIDGAAYIDELALSETAGEGSRSIHPKATNTYALGKATYYWSSIYVGAVYYKTQATFDDYDDLALIEAYTPGDVVKEADKGGTMRKVRQGDGSTIPWPMLGPVDPDNGGHFIHAPDATMFLLGGIKQMHQLHKRTVSKLEGIIEGLTARLDKIEAIA